MVKRAGLVEVLRDMLTPKKVSHKSASSSCHRLLKTCHRHRKAVGDKVSATRMPRKRKLGDPECTLRELRPSKRRQQESRHESNRPSWVDKTAGALTQDVRFLDMKVVTLIPNSYSQLLIHCRPIACILIPPNGP
jgi:hypothetical protein